MATTKKIKARTVISVPQDVWEMLKDEQGRIKKDNRLHVSMAALLRKAVEKMYPSR